MNSLKSNAPRQTLGMHSLLKRTSNTHMNKWQSLCSQFRNVFLPSFVGASCHVTFTMYTILSHSRASPACAAIPCRCLPDTRRQARSPVRHAASALQTSLRLCCVADLGADGEGAAHGRQRVTLSVMRTLPARP